MAVVRLADVIPSRFAHLTPTSAENVERIRADLAGGSKIMLNDPHVFRVGSRWELLAGHDRVAAARLAGWEKIQVRDFSGLLNDDDAILAHFCRENLLRKDISKATIAGEWLTRHPDWSDGRVAEASGCSADTVADHRAVMIEAGNLRHVGSRVGLDEKVRDVGPTPRAPRKKGPLGRKPNDKPTPEKPKYESPEQIAAALTKKAASPQGAEREQEAPGVSTTKPTDDAYTDSPPSEPSGAGRPAGAPASQKDEQVKDEAGAASDRLTNEASDVGLEAPGSGVPQLDAPVSSPAEPSDPASVGGVGVPQRVSVALSLAFTPLTEAEALACPLSTGDALLALGAQLMTAGKRIKVVHENRNAQTISEAA